MAFFKTNPMGYMEPLTSHQKTKKALLWMNLSHEPFVVLYTLLPFILRKDLGASLLQISILTALRPVLPLFSFYWSAGLSHKRHKLRANLIGAWILGRIPFLLIPWIKDAWYLIFCCAVYEFFHKSGIPALMEILKINIPKEAREKTYTFYFVLSFLESIILGLFMGGLLDLHEKSWQILCGLTALFGLSSVFMQLKVPIPEIEPTTAHKIELLKPWKEAFSLLKKRPDFARFQWGFMTGGFSLMLITPSLSIFYVDCLEIAHSQISMGRSVFMGIGIVASSYFWQKGISKLSISKLTTLILIGFGLFPLILLLSFAHMQCFYLAFIFYGVAQAGSHLLWNLSGTLFSATEEDSSLYSSVNILMIGVRGLIAPILGGISCKFLGPVPTLIAGACLCFFGAIYAKISSRQLTLARE